MSEKHELPLIVGFVADFMTTTKVENVARQLGFEVTWFAQASDVGEVDLESPTYQAGEPLYGQGGILFEKLTQWQPALLIFDLSNADIPWRKWISTIKSSPATRRIPILAFGPHVEAEMLRVARQRGADEAVPRSKFSAELPQLIESLAHIPDRDAVSKSCEEPLAPLALEGIRLFNAGNFFDAHEELEDAWHADQSAARDLYRSLIQIAVSYYHIERGNYRGAVKMLLRVRQWLAPLPDVCRGVDLARLREDVVRVHDAIMELGPERVDEVDRALFRPVRLVDED